jgi:hypothetical protein
VVARTIAGDTSYLYAIGGRTGAGGTAAVSTQLLRSQVLRASDAPVMGEIDAQPCAGAACLAQGTYYYRVSALVSDPANPGGETLPSDEESAVLDGTQSAVVHWNCVGAATIYRIYRTTSADQRSNTETFLTTAPTSGCSGPGPGSASFTDDGSVTSSDGTAPLPAGALGNWVDLSAGAHLGTGRFDFQARAVGDDFWVVGGCTSASGCTTAATSTASVERFSFGSATDLTPANAASGGTLQQARDQHAMAVATPATASTGSASYLVVVGGEANGTEITKTNAANGASIEVALINAGGTLTFPAPSNSTGWKGAPQNVGRGGWAEVAANQAFFEMALTGSASANASSSSLCGGSTCSLGAVTDFNFNFNAGFPTYTTNGSTNLGSARFLVGEQLFRAFVYAVGGFNSTSDLTPTNTVGRVVY